MEIEQTTGSVIAFVMNSIEMPGVVPYLWTVPEGYRTPSVYFEPDVTESHTLTLEAYRLDHTMYVQMFGRDVNEAVRMAQMAQVAICRRRHMVPVIDSDTNPTGDCLHMRQADVRVLSPEEATAQLALAWRTSGWFDRNDPNAQKMIHLHLSVLTKE